MTVQRYQRPLVAIAAAAAVISLVAVAAVLVLAFNHAVAPAWLTSIALYGLPLAFALMLAAVIGAILVRRQAREPDGG